MNKVIELIRTSTEEQAAENRAGIPAQRAANRRTAAQYGLDIVRTIELTDVSGAAVMRAPEMQELLRLMESPEIHGVVTREFSRLMRPENFADYALLQAFVDTGTMLYLAEGPINLGSKSGRLLGTIRAAIAGLERSEILERTWSAKEEKRRAGKHVQSCAALPFGISYEHGAWYYKPEAEKVREAFRLFLTGEQSYLTVGRKVGIAPSTLRVILRNPIYSGWRVYDKRRDPSPLGVIATADGSQGGRRRIAREPADVIRVRIFQTPLVSEPDFERLQQILELKKQNHWRARDDYPHRFTYNGFLRCGECRAVLYTSCREPSPTAATEWYFCRSRSPAGKKAGLARCSGPYMRRDKLESELDTMFADRLTDTRFLESVASEFAARSQAGTTAIDSARMEAELERLEGKRRRVLEAYFEGDITREEKGAQLAGIESSIKFYRESLASRSTSCTLLPMFGAEDLAEAFGPFFEWRHLGRKHKRRLLQALVPEIHVRDYRVQGLYVLSGQMCRDKVIHRGAGGLTRASDAERNAGENSPGQP
jgi:site-specific DNA recombinase